MEKTVVTRFCPSNTGPLHVGGVRTALYNYLFAKKHGGKCLFRLEDTDRDRCSLNSEYHIIGSLRAVGIKFDNTTLQGIESGYPTQYRNAKSNLYTPYINKLVEEGKAYYAFDTKEDLDRMREAAKASGTVAQKYDYLLRMRMKNSLTLSAEETSKMLSLGEYVIRFKTPERPIYVTVKDEIRGKVNVSTAELDDKVLFRVSKNFADMDGMPTYHLANIVDDHIAGVTHVIRGEEWLPSVPLHALIHDAFGWERPVYAHLPLILRPDGKGKLSKRDGAKFGFPVYVMSYSDDSAMDVYDGLLDVGFTPSGIVNFLALLGWNPGGNREYMTMEDMIANFDLKRVNKAGARFDYDKAKWLNGKHMEANLEEMTNVVCMSKVNKFAFLQKDNYQIYAKAACESILQGCKTTEEMLSKVEIYYRSHRNFDPKSLERIKAEYTDVSRGLFEKMMEFDASLYGDHEKLSLAFEELSLNMGHDLKSARGLLRIVVTGRYTGPKLFEMLCILGKAATDHRLKTSLTLLEE
jgi:glutamyl-tRNA synthetase